MLKTLTREQRHSLGMAATHYAQALSAVEPYLAGRGLGRQAGEDYLLGCVAEPLPGDEQYAGRLSLPYISPAGVTDIRYRCVQAHDCKEVGCPKYLGRPGVETGVFNVMALHRDSSVVAIVEGEIDAITLDPIVPTVGMPGANSWKRFYSRLFADYERVLVVCDGDDAGHTFGRTVLKAVDEATVIHCPTGQDVNSVCQQGGEAALRRLIGAA